MGEPVEVGQASGEEPEDLPPDEGPLLVPLEGAGRLAEDLLLRDRPTSWVRLRMKCRRLGRLTAALTSQKHGSYMRGVECIRTA
jgi:hypothetical protein